MTDREAAIRQLPSELLVAALPEDTEDDARIKKIFTNNCTACHSVDYISTQPRGPKFKKDFWQAEVTKMIKVYGAPIDDADVPKIVDYLAATY